MGFDNIDIKGTLDSFVEGTKETAEIAHQKTSTFHKNYISKVTPDLGKYGDAARFVAEMAPGVSEYNAIREGDWQGFAISAGIDVAAVAIGAFSAGTGYAAVKGTSTAAKAGVKVATKEIAEVGAKKAVKEVVEAGAKKATKEMAEAGTEKAVKEVAEAGTKRTAKEVAEASATKAAKEVAEAGVNKTVNEVVEARTEKVVKEIAKNGSKTMSKEITETGEKKAVKEITEIGVEKNAKKVVEVETERATNEVAEKITEKKVKEVIENEVEKTAKEVNEDEVKKIAKETVDTGAEKSVKETSEEGSEKIVKDAAEEASETAKKEGSEKIDQVIDKNVVAIDLVRELEANEIKKLIDNGMSTGIVKNCTIKNEVVQLKTINEKLVDSVHPESGVLYVKKIIDFYGTKIEGVFPKFDAAYITKLPTDKLRVSDKVQFDYCVDQLKKAIIKNPTLKERFSPRQLEQIMNGKTPGGYTWHHNEEIGKMELIDTAIHNKASHVGGRAIWGSGNDFR